MVHYVRKIPIVSKTGATLGGPVCKMRQEAFQTLIYPDTFL